MAVETASDRLTFLADFGQAVRWTISGGRSKTVTAIFDYAYEMVDAGSSAGFAVRTPRIVCRSADVVGIGDGDTVLIDGDTFLVRVVMPDGTGMTEVQLEAQ
jgi:hypothetical protein